MDSHDQIIDLLRRIEANQRSALEVQERQVAFAKAQLERSERIAAESVALQKTAVERQRRVGFLALPLIVLLIVLLAWLLVRWRIVLF
ncbi:MAG: hypothetical protein U1F51_14020 [Burkholderiales bacterium]